MLLLTIGDAHIPDRAIQKVRCNVLSQVLKKHGTLMGSFQHFKQDIPLKFKKLLSVPEKISNVALLGNSTRSIEFLNFLNQISSNLTIVRGEHDNQIIQIPQQHGKNNVNGELIEKELPFDAVIKLGNFKIGCTSGYTIVPKNDPISLLILARQLDVDILLWGGTHNLEAYTLEGKFFVNPGSCTGAFNSDWPIPSDTLDDTETVNNKDQSNVDSSEENNTNQDTDASNSMIQNEIETKQEGNEENRQEEEETENSKGNESIEEEDIEIPETSITGSSSPSFCLLDIQGSVCTLYIYLYVEGEVKVDKVVYNKHDVID